MPTYDEHTNFVRNHPYRGWWLIYDFLDNSKFLGTVYINADNSIGLQLDFSMVSFTASHFTEKLKSYIQPNPSQPSKIYEDYFYNVSPQDYEFMDWLDQSNYTETQRSFSLRKN